MITASQSVKEASPRPHFPSVDMISAEALNEERSPPSSGQRRQLYGHFSALDPISPLCHTFCSLRPSASWILGYAIEQPRFYHFPFYFFDICIPRPGVTVRVENSSTMEQRWIRGQHCSMSQQASEALGRALVKLLVHLALCCLYDWQHLSRAS